MARINVLDRSVSQLIAAGEVVERPASVVKELVENAIDSNADKITVEIENGGISYIRVSDNGSGIEKEDIPKAFLRHATSKVETQDDLDAIMTMGFRGEALASICAVSKVTLITKTANQLTGTMYVIKASQEISSEEIGCNDGTSIIAENLFFNVPARMKFLKKDVTEGNAVAGIVDKLALSHPEISFSFIRNAKEIFNTPGNNSIKSTIYSLYGKELANDLIEVDYTLDEITVKGFVCKPFRARSNRKMQVFFINSRYIKSQIISVALEKAYKGSILTGKFPSAFLYLTLSPKATDINVHPTKTEVKFADEHKIFECVYYGVRSALQRDESREQIEFTAKKSEEKPKKEDERINQEKTVSDFVPIEVPKKPLFNGFDTETHSKLPLRDIGSEPELFMPRKISLKKEENLFSDFTAGDKITQVNEFEGTGKIKDNEIKIEVPTDEIKEENTKAQKPVQTLIKDFEKEEKPWKFIGEVFSTYIVVENGDELLFIDKHALHERLIYEKLKQNREGRFLQTLLEPVKILLSKEDYDTVLESLDILSLAGFDTSDFGNGFVLVRTVPLILAKYGVEDVFCSAVEALHSPDKNEKSEILERIYHNTACKSAIKANDNNSPEELTRLAKKLYDEDNVKYCPHGRPVSVVLTKKEIEKKFKRT